MTVSNPQLDAKKQIAKASGVIMIAFVLSQLTGLVRQILVANVFGTTAPMEAYNAANQVAESLFNLVAGGALSSAFIPAFTALLVNEKRKEAWKLASSIANILLIVIGVLSILAAIFAPQIVRTVLAPGFAADPVKEQLTIDLMRLMLPSAAIFALSALVMGILNTHKIFFIPALTASMYQLGLIFGLVFLVPSMGIFGLGWGVLIGASMHLLLQVPLLFKQGGKYSWILGLDSPAVRNVARLMGPRILGVAAVRLNFWINTRLASRMPEGSVTGIVLAFSLMLMPHTAIAQSIATAAMPTLSAQSALGKRDDFRSSLASSLRAVLVFSIPASVGLILLRIPIITLLYQRGAFTPESTELVSWALLWYAAGLVGHSVVEILARAFYALYDTKTPVLIGILAMGANIGLSFLLSDLFFDNGYQPHGGLALANSIATGAEALILLWIMRKRIDGLNGAHIWDGLFKTLIAALLMAVSILGWLRYASDYANWIIAISGVLIGGLVFSISAYLLKISEIKTGSVFLLNQVKRIFP